jgi:hypothetical protein
VLDGKTIIGYALSAAAILGPVAYICFAFIESGRLGYFGAPNEFMQLSVFGILPVIWAVYPPMFVTFLVLGILSGLRYATPSHKIVLVAVATLYVSMVLFYLSLTPTWQWVFAISGSISFVSAIFSSPTMADIGNEQARSEELPKAAAAKHFSFMKRYVLVLSGIVIIPMAFIQSGVKAASTQEYYWVSGSEVVLGFYGDLALMGALSRQEVGPMFRFVELKSLSTPLAWQKIGPLAAAPAWQPVQR